MKIQYEETVSNYLEGLTTQLRKFSPSEEFLDLWVHDENHTSSLLNMIEAAHSHGLSELLIDISEDSTGKEVDQDKLKKATDPWASVNFSAKKGGGLLVDVRLNREVKLTSLTMDEVPAIYRPSFTSTALVNNFEKRLMDKKSFILSRASHGGIELAAHIDPQTDIIQEISFSGPTTPVSKKLMNELCHHILQKPVNEVHDHSVIYLEYFLRDKSQKRTPFGILTPFNSWSVFKELTSLVRKLVEQYRGETGRRDPKNFYSPAVSSQWKALSDSEKIDTLSKSIKTFCHDQKINPDWIVVKGIQNQYKVIVDQHPDVYNNEKTTLLNLEAYLREKVELTLCIHNEEEPDRNKMRWDRPAVKTQVAVPKKIANG